LICWFPKFDSKSGNFAVQAFDWLLVSCVVWILQIVKICQLRAVYPYIVRMRTTVLVFFCVKNWFQVEGRFLRWEISAEVYIVWGWHFKNVLVRSESYRWTCLKWDRIEIWYVSRFDRNPIHQLCRHLHTVWIVSNKVCTKKYTSLR
jgi:hypothetical protein